MKKPTKTKAVKAVKYWAAPESINLYRSRKEARYFSGFHAPTVKPVALVPMDAASVEAMVEQMAEAAWNKSQARPFPEAGLLADAFREEARAALVAIGIKGGAK